jgi:hypothetical protein
VRVRNVSNRPITIATGGGCSDLVGVELRPTGTQQTSANQPSSIGHGWNGRLDTLDHYLSAHDAPRVIEARSNRAAWAHELACAAIGVAPTPLAPGQTHVQQMTVDLRWGIGPIPKSMQLVATTGPIGPVVFRGTPPPQPVTLAVTKPFVIQDDPRRLGSVEAILGSHGLSAAPTLQDWINLTRSPGRGKQTWQTDLTWWRGGWELWISPDFSDARITGPLRIRWDPTRGRVVDVRSIGTWGGGATDEPDTPKDVPPDHIRYHLN